MIRGSKVVRLDSVTAYIRNTASNSNLGSASFDNLSYFQRIRRFSRNAKLYMAHIFGMDFIYGTWEVLFNLYLLAIGFNAAFIGLRLLIAGIVGAVAAFPSGLVSDRIGRKASFILGDGGGAAIALIEITSTNPLVLLSTPAIKSIFGTLHHVTESPFMAENSEPPERVHLFSVATGFRTVAAMFGALAIAAFPVIGATVEEKILFYRIAVAVGIVGWFLSLIPALMLRTKVRERRDGRTFGLTLRNVKHPKIIRNLVGSSALIALGAGFTLPFLQVYFKVGLDAHEVYIGGTYAVGSAFLAVGSFLAPFLVARLGKVSAIFVARIFSIPFILLLALTSQLGEPLGIALGLASIAFVARNALMNMSNPVYEAFSMELLDPSERGSYVGLDTSVSSILNGAAGLIGGALMAKGDFLTPFLVMASLYTAGIITFLRLFRPLEERIVPSPISA